MIANAKDWKESQSREQNRTDSSEHVQREEVVGEGQGEVSKLPTEFHLRLTQDPSTSNAEGAGESEMPQSACAPRKDDASCTRLKEDLTEVN